MEFTIIESQEQLDVIIGERLKREKEKYNADKQGILDELSVAKASVSDLTTKLEEANNTIGGFDAERNDLNSKIKSHETNSVKMGIALELGINPKLASKLTGEDEEAIREDAENLIKLMGGNGIPPMADPEPTIDDEKESYRKLLKSIKGE